MTRSAPSLAERPILEASEVVGSYMRVVLDAIPLLVSFVTADERYGYVNPAYERWFGIPRENILGRTLLEVIGEEAYDKLRPYVRRGLSGEHFSFEQQGVPYRLGGTRDVKVSFTPHRDAGGVVTGYVAMLEDVTEQRRLEREREQLAQQRTEVLDAIGDAFFSLDSEWRLVLVNGAFARLVGHGVGALVGRVFWDLFPAERDPNDPNGAAYRRCMVQREDVSFTAQLRGSTWLDIRGYPTADGGIAVFFRDVSAQKRADEQLARQSKELSRLLQEAQATGKRLEEASHAKDEFLATASHELRTPLNAILGWAQLLRGQGLEPSRAQKAAETIERNARAQVRLIEDILDGSRIITGKLRLEVRPLNLTTLVRAALDAVRAAAEAKEISLTVQLDPAAAQLVGDPERLQQVVWNLANNAIKFTPRGGSVEVTLSRSGASIHLAVSDTGQGIPPEFLPHVFDRFSQAEGSSSRRHGGLGLGLALVRHLVEAHGGTVSAESLGLDQGARFVVTLPVRAVYERLPSSDRPRSSATASSPLRPGLLAEVRALVVDDDPDSLELVTAVLRASGARVTAAANAHAALQALSEGLPHVVISDLGMPGVDGYELMRRIRQIDGATPDLLPAIAVSAYSREQDRRKAIHAGFQAHLTKPADPNDLIRLVESLVSTSRASAGAESLED